MPMHFPHPPTALHRRVRAGIGRVIEPLDRLAKGVDTRPQAMEPWCPPTAAGRSIVHVELYPLARPLLHRAESLPPRRQRLDETSARLRGTAAGHIQLRRVFSDDPTRALFFFAPQVRRTSLGLTTGLSPARTCPKIDRGFTVPTEAFALLGGLACVGVFFYGQQ